jgi:hypothetical protein
MQMPSVYVSKVILNLLTSLFVVAVAIYSLVSPFMSVKLNMQIPGAQTPLFTVVDYYVDKICTNDICVNADSDKNILASYQKGLYALYIILIILVVAFLLLHMLKVDIKPWWLTSVIMIALCLTILLMLVIGVKTYSINNTTGDFTTASTLMLVAVSMLIFKKIFYIGLVH